MRITIVGAGAMGCVFGGMLSRVADVSLLDPWEEHVAAIRRHGLRVTEPSGEQVFPVYATTNPGEITASDLAIIFVKSHQTEWAAKIAQGILKADSLALTLQNGLGNRDVLARILGAERAWQGVTAHGATLLGPGHVRHAGRGITDFETRPEIASRAQTIIALFQAAGLEARLQPDLEALIWGKLIVNVAINPLTAILRVPNGVLIETAATRALMDEAVAEAALVANAKHVNLPYADPIQHAHDVAIATAANRSSMLQDVLRGARTEIDVINGAIVREAKALGLAAPANELLTNLVSAIESTYDQRVN